MYGKIVYDITKLQRASHLSEHTTTIIMCIHWEHGCCIIKRGSLGIPTSVHPGPFMPAVQGELMDDFTPQ